MSALWGNVWGQAWMRLTPIKGEKGQAEGVQVWRADLDHPPVGIDVLARTLSGDEHVRANRFHRPRDRDRFVAARGLLRGLLGDILGCLPSSLCFHYNTHGKPALEGDGARLGFNLSHSEGIALFALVWGREVGVDIERVQAGVDLETLAQRYLPAQEAAALRALPPVRRPDAFTQAWVRHEAYLKALGLGFSSPTPPPEQDRWVCLDLQVGPEYRAALVVSAKQEHGPPSP